MLEAEQEGREHSESAREPSVSDSPAPAQPGRAEAEREPLSFDELAAFAEARLRDAVAQIEALRQSASMARARLGAELQVHKRRASNAEDRVQEMEAALRQAQETTEEQRITCAELTTVLRAAEYRLSNLEKTLALRDQELAALRQNYDGELEHARARIVELDDRLAQAERESFGARERFRGEQAQLSQERSALEMQIAALERRLGERNEEGRLLAAELQRARESATSLEAQLRDLTRGGGGGSRLGELQKRVVELEAVVSGARERETTLGDEIRQLNARSRELEEQLAKRGQRCQELEGELEQRAGELEERRAAFEEASRERRDLQTLVSALIADGEQLRRDLVQAQASQQAALEQRTAREARVLEIEKALQTVRENEALLHVSVEELQELLQKEQSGSAILRSELQTQMRLREAQEAELLETRSKLNKVEAHLHSSLQQHMLQLAKSTDRCRALEAERDSLQEQTVALVAQKERLERECDQLRRRAEMEKQKAEMARLQAKLEEVELRHPSAVRPRPRGETAARPEAGRRVPEQASAAPIAPHLPIIAIGASTGGPAALGAILPIFPRDFGASLLIVQHMPPGYTAELASCLGQQSRITVLEARDGDALRPGVAYLAPGGYHMEVRSGLVRLRNGPPVNKHRPSVDVLFDSLVPVASRVHAVLLSGMGQDGVAAMGRLRAAGAEAVVQDEATSVVWGMPGAAVKAGCVRTQLPPPELGRYLLDRVLSPQENAAPKSSSAFDLTPQEAAG